MTERVVRFKLNFPSLAPRLGGTVEADTGGMKRRLTDAVDRANRRLVRDLKEALDDAMRSNSWSGGDIVDTGELMASGRISLTDRGLNISYDKPYAALVHYGGYIHPYGRTDERVYLPARPWVEAVLNGLPGGQNFDIKRYYIEEVRKAFP